MAKTLSASQTTEAAGFSHDLQPILKVEWPAPFGTIYYTLRDFQIDPALSAKPLLVSFPTIRREIGIKVDSSLTFFRSKISIFNDPDDSNRVENILANLTTVKGVAASLYYVFDPAGSSVSQSDWILLGDFAIETDRATTTRVILELVDVIQPSMNLKPGVLIERDDFLDAPGSSIGQMIPFIFGEVLDTTGILTEAGGRTSLQANISDVATVIPVYALDDLPATGTIIIGAEEITYTAVDAVSSPPTVGTAGTPAVRGANGTANIAHGKNSTVREKLARYRYILSYHANVENANVRLNDILLTVTTDYVVTETTLDGHAITYVDLNEMPVESLFGVDTIADELTATLLVDVKGIEDADSPGTELSDISGVIEYLVTNADFANQNVSRLDLTTLNAAITAIGASSWRLDRRVYRPAGDDLFDTNRPTNLSLLSEACWNVGLRLSWSGSQIVIFEGLGSALGDSVDDVAVIDMYSGRENTNVEKNYDQTDDEAVILNNLSLFYNRGFTGNNQFKSTSVSADIVSQAAAWGDQARDLFAEWVRDDTTADGAAAKIVADNSWRRIPTTTNLSLRKIAGDIGDVHTLDDSASLLDSQPARIIGSQYPSLDQVRFKYVVSERRSRIWEHDIAPADAVTYIDAYDGFARWIIVIDSVVVAQISFDGQWFIGGELTENAFTGETVQAAVDGGGIIEYDDSGATNKITFGVRNEGDTDYITVLTLDENGDLASYLLEEQPAYPLTAAASPTFGDFPPGAGSYYKWDAATAATHLTLDLARTMVEIERIIVATKTNAVLKMKGLVENAF